MLTSLRGTKSLSESRDFIKALHLSLPIFCAFFPIGVAFGLVCKELGLDWLMSLSMSFFIYAGSSEFIIASMLSAGEPVFKIAMTTFLVNIRHIFYGFSVSKKIPQKGLLRYYTIATLSDETWALLSSPACENNKMATIIAALNHFYWFFSVFVGVLLGKAIDLDLKGLDFCLPALFIVLLIEQWQKDKDTKLILIGLLCGAIGFIIAAEQMILIGILLASIYLFVSYRRTTSE